MGVGRKASACVAARGATTAPAPAEAAARLAHGAVGGAPAHGGHDVAHRGHAVAAAALRLRRRVAHVPPPRKGGCRPHRANADRSRAEIGDFCLSCNPSWATQGGGTRVTYESLIAQVVARSLRLLLVLQGLLCSAVFYCAFCVGESTRSACGLRPSFCESRARGSPKSSPPLPPPHPWPPRTLSSPLAPTPSSCLNLHLCLRLLFRLRFRLCLLLLRRRRRLCVLQLASASHLDGCARYTREMCIKLEEERRARRALQGCVVCCSVCRRARMRGRYKRSRGAEAFGYHAASDRRDRRSCSFGCRRGWAFAVPALIDVRILLAIESCRRRPRRPAPLARARARSRRQQVWGQLITVAPSVLAPHALANGGACGARPFQETVMCESMPAQLRAHRHFGIAQRALAMRFERDCSSVSSLLHVSAGARCREECERTCTAQYRESRERTCSARPIGRRAALAGNRCQLVDGERRLVRRLQQGRPRHTSHAPRRAICRAPSCRLKR